MAGVTAGETAGRRGPGGAGVRIGARAEGPGAGGAAGGGGEGAHSPPDTTTEAANDVAVVVPTEFVFDTDTVRVEPMMSGRFGTQKLLLVAPLIGAVTPDLVADHW